MEQEISGSISFEEPVEVNENTPPPVSPSQNKIIRIVLIVFSALFFIVLGAVGYKLFLQYNSPIEKPTMPEEKIVTPTQMVISPTEIPTTQIDIITPRGGGAAVFQSNTLGIRFQYPKELGTDVIYTKEEGNKIFVYPENTSPSDGQSVEVFEKQESQTLQAAIEERFLSGKDPTQCFIQITPKEQGIVHAEIAFPEDPNDDIESIWNKSSYCSEGYARTNGIRYFWYDPTNPTKYLFLNIGQYGIPVSDTTSWQDTIEIIK